MSRGFVTTFDNQLRAGLNRTMDAIQLHIRKTSPGKIAEMTLEGAEIDALLQLIPEHRAAVKAWLKDQPAREKAKSKGQRKATSAAPTEPEDPDSPPKPRRGRKADRPVGEPNGSHADPGATLGLEVSIPAPAA